jgi:hypothetical protein
MVFTHSTLSGSSGSPVLDDSGAAIGVLAMAAVREWQRVSVNRKTGEKKVVDTTREIVDFGVNYPTMLEFLRANNVNFRISNSRLMLSSYQVELSMKNAIVSVMCTPKK